LAEQQRLRGHDPIRRIPEPVELAAYFVACEAITNAVKPASPSHIRVTMAQRGGGLRLGFPITEYWNFGTRYNLVKDKITLDKATFYTNGVCDPVKAGQYLCDEVGNRLTSSLGYSVLFGNTEVFAVNTAGNVSAVSFTGNGAGLTNLDAGNITSGTLNASLCQT